MIMSSYKMKFLKYQVASVGPILALLCATVLIGRTFVATHAKLKLSALEIERTKAMKCEKGCRPNGTEALPKGIISSTSDLQMRPLWDSPAQGVSKKSGMNLLAMAVGKKQKENVDKTVRKFLVSNFVVMLFHYDGNVDDWRDLEWSANALHVAAGNQTKWWFAKRFLHPDIVAEYSYIFLWDEDLGVENFNAQSYLSIIKKEGLEISQPAIDPEKSEFHHLLTVRQNGVMVHRRIYGNLGRVRCDEHSTQPPCTGWVEMMAPVFSRAAWRCAWYMIQNDLIHGWGMDYQFGYCAQGDRTENIGVVDSDYIIHYGVKTLGSTAEKKGASNISKPDSRSMVRKQSYAELWTFHKRWQNAVENDECWTDPFQPPKNQEN